MMVMTSTRSSGRGRNPNSQIHPSHLCRDVLYAGVVASVFVFVSVFVDVDVDADVVFVVEL